MKIKLLSPNRQFSIAYDSTTHILELSDLVRRTCYVWRYLFSSPTCLCWSADSRFIAIALPNSSAPEIYTVATGGSLPAYSLPMSKEREPLNPILTMAFSPDGLHLAIGRRNGEVEMISLVEERVLWKKHFTHSSLSVLSFTPGGTYIASGRLDGLLVVQHVSSAELVRHWKCPIMINELRWDSETLEVHHMGQSVQMVDLSESLDR